MLEKEHNREERIISGKEHGTALRPGSDQRLHTGIDPWCVDVHDGSYIAACRCMCMGNFRKDGYDRLCLCSE